MPPKKKTAAGYRMAAPQPAGLKRGRMGDDERHQPAGAPAPDARPGTIDARLRLRNDAREHPAEATAPDLRDGV